MIKAIILLPTFIFGLLPLNVNTFNFSLAFPGDLAPATEAALEKMGKVIKDHQIEKKEFRIKTIVIDPGHGGHDPGCLGGHSREKHLALGIGKAFAEKVRQAYPEIRVIMTRDEDVFIPLYERAAIANRNDADLFISIHCNFMPGLSRVTGSETYVMGLHTANHNLDVAKRENAAILLEDDYEKNYDYDPNSPEGHIMLSMFQNAHLDQSILFAERVEENIKVVANRRSRGVKQAGFVVLKETTMPSVLVEAGFLSNRQEEAYLKSKEGQNMIASALLRAFTEYKSLMETGKKADPPALAVIAEEEPPKPKQETTAPVLRPLDEEQPASPQTAFQAKGVAPPAESTGRVHPRPILPPNYLTILYSRPSTMRPPLPLLHSSQLQPITTTTKIIPPLLPPNWSLNLKG